MELSLSELKNSINLIDLISQDLGENKVARITPTSAVTKCVFHAEDTPSLRISATHYHCFGCGARGDGIDWLRKYRGMSFRDAVAMFGGKGLSSIKAKPQAKSAPTPIESDARLAIFETNCKVYDELVALGGDAQYIKKRGLTGSYCGRPIAALWPAGFTPRGVSLEEGKRAGLVGVSLHGNAFWRMSGRVVLPTFNRRGGILAFTGRAVVNDVQPRYICTPDTPLYRKKNCLYWLGSSSPSRLYILEGLIDAASFWSNLKDDTVAVVSTQGTTSKLPFKPPCASSILFDSDLPGIRGAYSLARSMEGDCEILLITSGHKDVNELICSNRSALDILGECVKVKRCGAMELVMGDGRRYSRKLLDELTAPFVKSNVDEGYPHYNSIPFLLSAYPSKADKLRNTIENMKANAKEKDGVYLLRKQDILNFMSAWAELCREVRIDKL